MSFYASVVRPLAFTLDAEHVHETAMGLIKRGLVRARSFSDPSLRQTLMGSTFENPLGLAAGFDKNGVALDQWRHLGFGFAEVGTVTLHAQPGNPKPRLFRLPEDRALINRMGFNNEGSRALAERIQVAHPGIPIGINFGKSKITPNERAASDYAESFRLLHSLGDYFVVNISSPNTPGLRELQDKGPLMDILTAVRAVDSSRPIFVKVAPDLELSALDEVLEVAITTNCTGIVATNTTISRRGLHSDPGQTGGLSGAPLREMSDGSLRHLAQQAPSSLVLIAAGGVFTAEDLYRKISLGAHLVQVYTGWVYGGPNMAPNVLEALAQRMAKEGIKSVEKLRGTGL